MCFYCGCREIPLIRELIAEHERITDIGADLTAALDRPDLGDARALLDEITQSLETHWRGEEAGLFAVMDQDDAYHGYLGGLVAEHRDLRDLLATADLAQPADRARITAAMSELHAHIAKEEDGLFPASLTALSGEQWDQAIRAWEAMHGADVETGIA